MPRDFNEYLHYKALELKFKTVQGEHLSNSLEALIDADSEVVPQTKNVCAKLSVQLSDELDAITSLLSMSKRQFIEMALIQAIEHANHLVECVDALGEGEGDE